MQLINKLDHQAWPMNKKQNESKVTCDEAVNPGISHQRTTSNLANPEIKQSQLWDFADTELKVQHRW